MTRRIPPAPPENRSPKGTGDEKKTIVSDQKADGGAENPEKRGQSGNTKINTTHQGYQQDR
ncbi:hypothetical protein DUT91_06660 [Phyllobacterium salinisoli]|uniref:Uncharacterized protein n=1 Tax=Phyllobacterium salinisoli TaxID=1899321 RepID=A0A368K9M6_9HYPH|nr:hypothetical protein [Phyllobacterium salinisoli]RCS25102.1 hypothetical protein DUT91_06660 [Phyllobacterium salinisoli]